MSIDPNESTQLIRFMYHPSYMTDDRDAMIAWLRRVFAREGVNQGEYMASKGYNDSYPTDYSHHIWLSDVWFDTIVPRLYQEKLEPKIDFPLERLTEMAWYANDAKAIFRRAREKGVRCYDQRGALIDAPALPRGTSTIHDDIELFWFNPRDVGLGVEICQMTDALEQNTVDQIARFDPSWQVPPVSDADPLSLVRASHHTVLTDDLPRALLGAVDVLDGRIIHQGRNETLRGESCFVYLADTVIEYLVPDADSPVRPAMQAKAKSLIGQPQEDVYHAINFQVADLDRARAHLKAQGIGLAFDGRDFVQTDPADCLGMRWGFGTHLVPGDPRARA